MPIDKEESTILNISERIERKNCRHITIKTFRIENYNGPLLYTQINILEDMETFWWLFRKSLREVLKEPNIVNN